MQMEAPADKDLRKYYDWLVRTAGEGEGLQREILETILGRGHALLSGVEASDAPVAGLSVEAGST